jgi:ribosome maturation factor RimP
MTSSDKLAPEISRVLERLGVELDDLTISKAGSRRVLDVVVDADDPIDLDRLADISRAVSELLDETDLMGTAPYVMEVGTRGIGRPLTKPAHWRRNVGRLVNVSGDSVSAIGRITEFDEPIVTLNIKGQLRNFEINTISRAVIEVDFSRKEGDV